MKSGKSLLVLFFFIKSYGNGAAMRVSPIGWAFDRPEQVLREAINSAKITHNHAEGLIGAIAVAEAVYEARKHAEDKDQMLECIVTQYYGEDWCEYVPDRGAFDVTCQGCVPLAFMLLLGCTDFEEAIREAISYGGDSDTLGAIVGAIAEPIFGIPTDIQEKALRYLPHDMRVVYSDFKDRFNL